MYRTKVSKILHLPLMQWLHPSSPTVVFSPAISECWFFDLLVSWEGNEVILCMHTGDSNSACAGQFKFRHTACVPGCHSFACAEASSSHTNQSRPVPGRSLGKDASEGLCKHRTIGTKVSIFTFRASLHLLLNMALDTLLLGLSERQSGPL